MHLCEELICVKDYAACGCIWSACCVMAKKEPVFDMPVVTEEYWNIDKIPHGQLEIEKTAEIQNLLPWLCEVKSSTE